MVVAQLTFNEIRQIRQGPLSRVILAKDIQLDNDLIVKEIPKNDFNNRDEYFTEAKILYSVKHPNIAEIQYACEDVEHIYLSMPYYPEGSLQRVYTEHALTIRKIIQYAINFLSGLHYIHTKGLLHLDVKPGNVLINNSNVAVLTDFGLSKYVNEYDLADIETVYQMHRSPEAFQSTTVGKQADIYQAGVTLYRMVNGEEEFTRQFDSISQQEIEVQIVSGEFPNRKFFSPHVPSALKKVIKKALEVDTDIRYESVLDMLNDLSKINKNLDWYYNFEENTQTHKWIKEEEKTVKAILLFEENGVWKTVGKQYSKKNDSISNYNKWKSEGHQNLDKSLKHISKLITEYEK